MNSQIFIGVGCVEAQQLPFEVLKFSILTRTSNRNLAIEPLYQCGISVPVPRNPWNRQKTPFSFQRFLIPEVCQYRGRSLYLDSDMIVLADIAPILAVEFGDADVLSVPGEFSVLVLDCARLNWDIRKLVAAMDDGQMSYDALMSGRAVAKVSYSLPKAWNWLDNSGVQPPSQTSLIHYTITYSQPWITAGNPLGHLWLKELFQAVDAGAVTSEFVRQQVDQGYVRPSLLYQLQNRLTAKQDLPKTVLEPDAPFAAFCQKVNYCITDGFRPVTKESDSSPFS